MNRLEKIEYLRKIQTGEIHPLDVEPFLLIVFDHELPEDKRNYFIWREGKTMPISRAKLNKITTAKIFLDFDDMSV